MIRSALFTMLLMASTAASAGTYHASFPGFANPDGDVVVEKTLLGTGHPSRTVLATPQVVFLGGEDEEGR